MTHSAVSRPSHTCRDPTATPVSFSTGCVTGQLTETLEWASWFNTERLPGSQPPVEFEAEYHTSSSDLAELVLK